MTVPTPIPYSSIAVASVISTDLVSYYMKVDSNNVINLATAAIVSGQEPGNLWTVFPAAQLKLG